MIFKTTDGGQTWVSKQSGTTIPLYEIFFVGSDTGWAVGSDGISTSIILKTTDTGNTWARKLLRQMPPIFSICFINSRIGWVVGGGE